MMNAGVISTDTQGRIIFPPFEDLKLAKSSPRLLQAYTPKMKQASKGRRYLSLDEAYSQPQN